MKQEFPDKLKVVKIEADPNPGLVEKYKVPSHICFKVDSLFPLKAGQPTIIKLLHHRLATNTTQFFKANTPSLLAGLWAAHIDTVQGR